MKLKRDIEHIYKLSSAIQQERENILAGDLLNHDLAFLHLAND